jgi:phage tail tape-measure protein
MPHEVTEKQWDRFFDIMAMILNMPGAWADKAARVRDEAAQRDLEGTLGEFVEWFAEEPGAVNTGDEEDL